MKNIKLDPEILDNIFKRYGYDVDEETPELRSYLMQKGMYYGVEIVCLNSNSSTKEKAEQRQSDYQKLGYANNIHYFETEKEAEDYLFGGFFKTDTVDSRIKSRYNEFAKKQMRVYNKDKEIIKYQYINVPFYSNYTNVNAKNGNGSIIDSVKKIINEEGASLIIVEAAAGFGKTCTAFEIFNSFANEGIEQKPLFAELSRNREARHFKYVLLSEIEAEYHSLISSDLVIYNVQQGKIPLIIDGFDELLTDNIDKGYAKKINDFEQVETMLSTIGGLLTNNAKVILTSRKTAIFSGEDFNKWVESYGEQFSVIRIQIETPRVNDWLSRSRYDLLIEKDIPLDHISNPVLLTYLKNISDDDFSKVLEEPDSIVAAYFTFLLIREQERQKISIPVDGQLDIFRKLANSFSLFDISCESRIFVKDLIIDNNELQLDKYRKHAETTTSLDELANKLVNHALLDRIGAKDYIGFINDFIFGILLGEYILLNKNDIIDILDISLDALDKSIEAFQYQSKDKKQGLWDVLEDIKDIFPQKMNLMKDAYLKKQIFGIFASDSLTGIKFSDVHWENSNCTFKDFTFIECSFSNCMFDNSAFTYTNFIGCTFLNCSILDNDVLPIDPTIYFYGCEDYDTDFIKQLSQKKDNTIEPLNQNEYEQLILLKFLKVDKKTPRMKLVSAIKDEIQSNNSLDSSLAFEVFHQLIKKGYIQTNGNNAHISTHGITYFNSNHQK